MPWRALLLLLTLSQVGNPNFLGKGGYTTQTFPHPGSERPAWLCTSAACRHICPRQGKSCSEQNPASECQTVLSDWEDHVHLLGPICTPPLQEL